MASHASAFDLFGPVLSTKAAKMEQDIKHLLPAEFDNTCHNRVCKKPMEFMAVAYCTERKPFATYQCPKCKTRLLIFEAPRTPIFVWSDEFAGITNFSAFVEEELQAREHKLQVRAKRYGNN